MNIFTQIRFSAIFLLCLWHVTAIHAQIIVIPVLNPAQTQYADTWSASVTNPISEGDAYAELKITRDGKQILESKSAIFRLPKGEYKLSYDRLRINTLIQHVSNHFSWQQYLQQGLYEICINIRSVENAWEGEGCSPLEIMPLSPPMLVSPMNKETVDPLPLLSWTPPIPLNIYEDLKYDLKLVEMMPMQSNMEAMATNLPLLYIKGTSALMYQYTFSNTPLKPGKSYAWQVTAKDLDRVVGMTEVWVFNLNNPIHQVKKELLPDIYYKIAPMGKAQTSGVARGCIGFTCEPEFLKNYTFELSDKKGVMKDTSGIYIKPTKQPNYFILYMNESALVKESKSYRLTIRNYNGNKYYLDFIYYYPTLSDK